MSNTIELKSINKDNNTVSFEYIVEGQWKKYFNLNEKFFITYPFDISDVPNGVLAVPFVSDFLPIIWLCDATAVVPELDQDFYDQIDNIKKGYTDMYPMLEFKGNLRVKNVSYNSVGKHDRSALLFRGGVDAYTSLFRHIDEKPILATLWGPDVDINNDSGWRKVENGIKKTAEDYKLDFIPIKTAMKKVINEPCLTGLVSASKDDWYHGFQHGIAIISHMAPVAYKKQLGKVYIASSFPAYAKGTYTCASDPTIDNYMSYCGCATYHDGYELDRQQKIHYIIQEKNEHDYKIRLHVCWESDSGDNCCHCEKCYRTAIEIVAEGASPNDYGFNWTKDNIKSMKRDFKYKLRLPEQSIKTRYIAPQKLMMEHKDEIIDIELYKWFMDMDLTRFNRYFVKSLYCSKIAGKIRKIISK
ncbi:MAG: hypothetical protein K6A23_15170 [Butyrivibrio sp.]|nr:hypothetical protein [Butyrivibrio sp.]